MPVYKDDKTGTYYFKINYNDAGKYKQKLRRGFRTKREATAAMVDMQDELNKGTYIEPSKDLLSDILGSWLKDKSLRVKKRTTEFYKLLIEKHINPVLGSTPIANITPKQIQDMYSEMAERRSLAIGSINKVHIILKAALGRAEEWDLIRKNPARSVTPPRESKNEMKYWTREQALQFLDRSRWSRHYAAFHLAISSGMRRGEILGLRWQDIDMERRIITVRQQYNGGELEPGAKTEAGVRSLGIDIQTVEVLQELKARTAREKEILNDMYTDLDLVVCNRKGSPIDTSNFRDCFNLAIERAGVPPIRFHDLRHTHVVMLLQARENSKRIAERLGWASVNMIDRYAHIMPDMRQETADLFSATFYRDDTNIDTKLDTNSGEQTDTEQNPKS